MEKKEAKLIATNPHGQELRRAVSLQDCWPGYAIPLPKKGLWFGNCLDHRWIPKEELEHRGFSLNTGGKKKETAHWLQCRHCGWKSTAGDTCPDCREFLATGVDPRPWCPRCGRSVPAGRVCPCLRAPADEPLDPCMECGQLLPTSEMVSILAATSGLVCRDCLQEEIPSLMAVLREAGREQLAFDTGRRDKR